MNKDQIIAGRIECILRGETLSPEVAAEIRLAVNQCEKQSEDIFIPLVDLPVGAMIHVDTKDFNKTPLLVIPDGKLFRAIPVPSNLTITVGKE